MVDHCETISKLVLPVFRSLVAKELLKTHHLTQVDTAKLLRTSQAAISQYTTSKRAIKGIEQCTTLLPKIQVLSCETANRLAKNQVSWDEVTMSFCKVCSALFVKENQTGDNYTI